MAWASSTSSCSTSASSDQPQRLVVLVDMDCFYCQVEEKLNPALRGHPVAVVQYNAWKGGGIIAVNYAARAAGVTRHMRGDQALAICPELQLASVPNVREKADLSRYRDDGKEVAAVLQQFAGQLERASVDEAYLDITQNVAERLRQMDKGEFTVQPKMLVGTYALGHENIGHFVQSVAQQMRQSDAASPDAHCSSSAGSSEPEQPGSAKLISNDVRLLIAATVCTEIRAAVKATTGYECSAGIAHNKILAKLVCGLNKPNKQTLLPVSHLQLLYQQLDVRKIRGLGGKFGDEVCERLKVAKMQELARFELSELQQCFDEKNALFLYHIARGIDNEPVQERLVARNIGCSKRFPGIAAIKGLATLQHWLRELATEICERVAKDSAENARRPRNMTISYTQANCGAVKELSSSRTTPISGRAQEDCEQLAADALDVIRRNTDQFFRGNQQAVLNNPIRFLGISVGKFEAIGAGDGRNSIREMFRKVDEANEKQSAARRDRGGSEEPDMFECSDAAEPEVSEAANEEEAAVDTVPKTLPAFFAIKPQPKEEKVEVEQDRDESIAAPKTLSAFFAQQAKTKVDAEQKESKEPIALPKRLPAFFAVKPPQKDEKVEQEHNEPAEQVDQKDQKEPTESIAAPKTLSAFFANQAQQNRPTSAAASNSRTTPAYLSEYAEFQAPSAQILAELEAPETEQCSECKQQVPRLEMQSHRDAHFAFAISEQQRKEFRNAPAAEKIKPEPQPETEPPDAAAATAQLERCPTCQKRVAPAEWQSHADAHFAFELSQQQRREYRSQISAGIGSPSKPPAAKRQRPNNQSLTPGKSTSASGSGMLQRFLVPGQTQSSDSQQPTDDRGALWRCDECARMIAVAERQEHQDYHTARRLQSELNRTVAASSQQTAKVGVGTKLRPKAKPADVKSVAHFFAKNCG